MSDSMLVKVRQQKVIPVIVVETIEEALGLGKVCVEENFLVTEVTFRSAIAKQAIKEMKAQFPSLIVGAGTVLNAKQADEAKSVGANFLVAPGLNLNTVKAAQDMGMPIIPGVNNPSAIEAALEAGLHALKFFPAKASGGPEMIKALLAPYRDIEFMPTGGINADNMMDYLSIDRVIACGLTWMVDASLLKAGNWEEVRSRIRQVVAKAALK